MDGLVTIKYVCIYQSHFDSDWVVNSWHGNCQEVSIFRVHWILHTSKCNSLQFGWCIVCSMRTVTVLFARWRRQDKEKIKVNDLHYLWTYSHHTCFSIWKFKIASHNCLICAINCASSLDILTSVWIRDLWRSPKIHFSTTLKLIYLHQLLRHRSILYVG